MLEDALGDEHPQVAVALIDLAELLTKEEDRVRAHEVKMSGFCMGPVTFRGSDRAGMTRPDPIRTDPTRSDPTRPDPTRPDSTRTVRYPRDES